MADLAKLFGTDKTLEQEGVLVYLGDGFKIRVARDNNPKYRSLLNAKFKQYRAQLRVRNLPDDVVERITTECMAEAILLGWEGAQDEGKQLDDTRENRHAMLVKYPDFRNAVAGISGDMTQFQQQEEEASRGN